MITRQQLIDAAAAKRQAWDDQVNGALDAVDVDAASLRAKYFDHAHAARGPVHVNGEERRMELLAFEVALFPMMGLAADEPNLDAVNATTQPPCCY